MVTFTIDMKIESHDCITCYVQSVHLRWERLCVRVVVLWETQARNESIISWHILKRIIQPGIRYNFA